VWIDLPEWKTISLPKEMLEEIRKFIDDHPEYGYSSVSDFVTTAIRAYGDYRTILEEPSERS